MAIHQKHAAPILSDEISTRTVTRRWFSPKSMLIPFPTDANSVHRCGIVTISSTHQNEADASGALVRGSLLDAGHEVTRQRWIADDLSNIRHLFREWIDGAELDVIIAIGGTGPSPTDVTPEALGPLVSKVLPGFGEALRMLAYQELGIHALESRACAAICQHTLVYLLPGAYRAVSIAVERLVIPQLSTLEWTLRDRVTMAPPAPALVDNVGVRRASSGRS